MMMTYNDIVGSAIIEDMKKMINKDIEDLFFLNY